MTAGGNADGKLSEQMEGEEVLRRVECLRGRLLAERAASRNAKEEAELMGSKLIELESRLQEETKSRNRAERRLKFLMKKLESLEIFYVSDESEQSSFVDKSEICSASSTSTKAEDKEVNTDPNLKIQIIQETMESLPKSSIPSSGDSVQNVLQTSSSSCQTHESPAAGEEEINSYQEPTAQKFETQELREKSLSQGTCHNYPVEEAHTEKNDSLICPIKEETLNGGGDEEQDDNVNNSMALVPVDLPKKTKQTIDPVVLDATVKEVLDALRHAKEKLQTSMEERRRRMVKVG